MGDEDEKITHMLTWAAQRGDENVIINPNAVIARLVRAIQKAKDWIPRFNQGMTLISINQMVRGILR